MMVTPACPPTTGQLTFDHVIITVNDLINYVGRVDVFELSNECVGSDDVQCGHAEDARGVVHAGLSFRRLIT